MRKITLTGTHTVSIPVPVPRPGDAGVMSLASVGPEFTEELETAKYNGGMFIWGASEVEKEMNQVIALAIVPPDSDGWISPAGGFFRQHFLEASYLEFSAKLKIIESLIEARVPMSNTQRKEFSEKIRRVQRYRNAFAHGKLTYHAEHGCVLSYHEGVHKTNMLNDSFLSKLEDAQASAITALSSLKVSMGKPWRHQGR